MKTNYFIPLFLICILLTFKLNYSQYRADQILFDNSGNIYVVCQTQCIVDSNILIIKYNPDNGNQLWANRLGITGNSFLRSAIFKDNFIYLTGFNNILGSRKAITSKCDLNGNFVKTSFADRVGGDYGNAITIDNANNIYVCGRTDSPIGYPKFYIIKYNLNLDSEWTYIYTDIYSGLFDEALSVKTDYSGNIYVTGYTSQGQIIYDTYDYLTLKLNSSGVLQWAKKHNGAANLEDLANGIFVDSIGNSIVTGFNTYVTGSEIFTIKYNTNGDSLSSASYRCLPSSLNYTTSMTNDNSGNIYLTGFGLCGPLNSYNYITIKYNSSLNQQWNKSYIGSSNSISHSIYYFDSYAYITGETDSVSGDRKVLTIKYNAVTGAEVWRWYFNTSDSNYSMSVITDQNSNVFVSGYSTSDTVVTAKYSSWLNQYVNCPPIGIKILSSKVPSDFKLYNNYPNPFNPSTKIKFDIKEKSFTSIVIYDVSGREIENLLEKELNPGSYEVDWNAGNNSSGVYFYTIKADNSSSRFAEAKKMILLK